MAEYQCIAKMGGIQRDQVKRCQHRKKHFLDCFLLMFTTWNATKDPLRGLTPHFLKKYVPIEYISLRLLKDRRGKGLIGCLAVHKDTGSVG